MEFVPDRRSAAMAVAHADARVEIIASRLVEAPIRQMVLLMKRALYSKKTYSWEAVRHLVADNPMQPSSSLAAANALADACLSISQTADIDARHRLRAAVLEAVTERLVRVRVDDVRVEHRACGLNPRIYGPNGCSRPLDVVAVAAPVEVFECKCAAYHQTTAGREFDIQQDDLTLFARLGDVAEAEGERLVCAFVTFLKRDELVDALVDLTAERTVYAVTIDELEELALRPAAQAVA